MIQEMAVPFIKGIQENDVAACVKHFAVNNQETERLWVDVEIDERTLKEIYLPGFEATVKKADVSSLMGAYNLIYGEHCCQSKWLLSGLLRDEWQYEGVVVSDWGGVHDTKLAAESGLDIEMSVTDNFKEYFMANPLKEAIQKGEIAEEHINEKVRNILGMMDKLHMLEGNRKSGCYNTPEHRAAVLEVARESVVLLKNEEKKLPLEKEKLKKLLIIGDNAERIHSNGGGSAEIKALYEISPLMGLKSKLGGNTEVTFARGYYVGKKKEESDTNWQETSLEQVEVGVLEGTVTQEEAEQRKLLLDEALQLAQEADEVIIVGGLNHDHDSEGNDRKDIVLPYGQDELIKEVLKVKPSTIVVMLSGSPVGMSEWVDGVKSLVWMGYAGMEGGNALADTLLGYINPSGKLAETFIKKIEDCPAHSIGEFPGGKCVAYREGIRVGYRYYDTEAIEVEFPFGYGLSYTNFEYSNLDVQVKADKVEVNFNLKNTGNRDGKEIIQLYVSQENPSVMRPSKELKGFDKISLTAGSIKPVRLILEEKDFSFYDAAKKKWVCEKDKYTIAIGSSSKDIRLASKVEIGFKKEKKENTKVAWLPCFRD